MQREAKCHQNRHRISILYAGLELPQAERDLFYTHMGHSESINKHVYQTPLAIQEITKVGKNLHLFKTQQVYIVAGLLFIVCHLYA